MAKRVNQSHETFIEGSLLKVQTILREIIDFYVTATSDGNRLMYNKNGL